MKKLILLLIFPLILSGQTLRMKRVCFLQAGQYLETDGKTLCWDTDHNGLNELIFATGTIYPSNPLRWEILEYRPMNHYERVYADTGAFPYPPGITTGNFRPNDVGDIDQDSFTDLLGPNFDQPQNPDTIYDVVTTQENPNYSSYPETLSWWYRYSNNFQGDGSVPFYFPPDLDSDNRNEIMFVTSPPLGCVIFENTGNNQNVVVWNITQGIIAWSFAFGDLDLDGHKEFISADGSTLGRVYIYENTGDDQYEPTVIDTVLLPNGSDVFSGNDLDGDGKPEFFITFARIVGGSTWDFFLYMWEATGNNLYEHTFVASQRLNVGGPEGRRSCCADIDGDGIEELIWATPTNITVFKATGNNQYQQIWQWLQDHGSFECLVANSYDMNKNGYKEIVVGGSGKTSIFELEAVRVLRPNGGEIFQADTQELIRWQTFHPPRCDSLSLFYSLDNGRSYDTIITGIPGADTSYLWKVPDISSDSCKVKIIAYGPGWQYDETDGVFRITPTGIEESKPGSFSYFRFEMLPNPAKGKVRFNIWNAGKRTISLKIYNLAGELVKTFLPTTNNQRLITLFWNGKDDRGKTIPNGVYIYRLKTSDGISETKEFIILK
jgi:FG-GAP-like repeat